MLQAAAEHYGLGSPLVPKISTGFCGGVSRTKGMCGAVSGGVMALGMVFGRTNADVTADIAYENVQEFLGLFKQRYGSLNCFELTGCDLGDEKDLKRFRTGGIKDKCREYTGTAARLAAEIIGNEAEAPCSATVKVYSKDQLPLRSNVPGAKMWAVALEKSMLTYFEMEPNTVFPEHSHEAEQITLVLDGELVFSFDGKQVALKVGDVVAIPSNVKHYVSTGKDGCRAVDAWSPVRKEYLP